MFNHNSSDLRVLIITIMLMSVFLFSRWRYFCRFSNRGMVLADENGMGNNRTSCACALALSSFRDLDGALLLIVADVISNAQQQLIFVCLRITRHRSRRDHLYEALLDGKIKDAKTVVRLRAILTRTCLPQPRDQTDIPSRSVRHKRNTPLYPCGL